MLELTLIKTYTACLGTGGMMRRTVILLVVLILMVASSASAFNGERKGFVLGGGLGFGPVAKVSIDDFPADDYDKSGLAMNFIIGYAWNEQNMIVFLRDAIIYSEDFDLGTTTKSISLAQGFSGVGYYHYFGPVGKSFFITGGIGLQDWISLDEDVESNDVGAGLLLGAGYEFARHWQVYGSVSFGKTKDPFFSEFEYSHTQLLFTISAVAF